MDKEEGEITDDEEPANVFKFPEYGFINSNRQNVFGPLSGFIAHYGEFALSENMIKLYRHSFQQQDINSILSYWEDDTVDHEVELNTLISHFKKNTEISNILCAIVYFETNWRSEFEFSFIDEFIEPINIEIVITPHGNVRETQEDPVETSKRINQLKNTKYVVPLANMGTIAYHLPSVSTLMQQGLTTQSKGVSQPLSKSKKENIRKLYEYELAKYKDHLQTKKTDIEKKYDFSDDNEYDEYLREKNWINKDINYVDKATESGSKSILKTLRKESLNTFNTQLTSMKSNEFGNPHDYGIIVIPNQSDDIAILFLKFCQAKMKIDPPEPDREYYANLFNFCVTKLIDNSGNIKTPELFETIISLKNKNAFYAFNMQKTGIMGSFIYEMVKKFVMQSGNEDAARLFFSIFSVDHLGTNTHHDICSLFIRTANRGVFMVEMLSILEIMDFVGPNDIIIGSCQTTTGDIDELKCAIADEHVFTQESLPNSPMYIPNSPPYSPNHPTYMPNSPMYIPNSPPYSSTSPPINIQTSPKPSSVLDELSLEGQLAKRPQSHRNKRFDRKYNTQKQYRQVGKIKNQQIYGIDGERGYYIKDENNYVKIKIDRDKQDLSFKSKSNKLRNFKSNPAKTVAIRKMQEIRRGGKRGKITRKVRR